MLRAPSTSSTNSRAVLRVPSSPTTNTSRSASGQSPIRASSARVGSRCSATIRSTVAANPPGSRATASTSDVDGGPAPPPPATTPPPAPPPPGGGGGGPPKGGRGAAPPPPPLRGGPRGEGRAPAVLTRRAEGG